MGKYSILEIWGSKNKPIHKAMNSITIGKINFKVVRKAFISVTKNVWVQKFIKIIVKAIPNVNNQF